MCINDRYKIKMKRTINLGRNFGNFFANLFNFNKSKDNLLNIIKNMKLRFKEITLDEQNIYNNLLKFNDQTVENIMIPRSNIVAINCNINYEELNETIMLNILHTRILVYQENVDNIIGFIHIKDLLKMLINQGSFEIKKILLKHIITVPSMKLIDLLTQMRNQRIHIATVIDEYGCTDGIVTIENIIETLLGPIDDEHDTELNNGIKILNNNIIISNARVKIEEISSIIGIELKNEDDPFETIGGMVLAKTGNIPLTGTRIAINPNLEIEVTNAGPRTINQVKLYLKNILITKK
jgi:CBS domain containing-hemolysin-like protein